MKLATLLGAASLAATALGTSAVAQDSELVVLDYPGFETPEFHQPYFDEHGQSPTFSFFGDEEEAFQKVQAGFRLTSRTFARAPFPSGRNRGSSSPGTPRGSRPMPT